MSGAVELPPPPHSPSTSRDEPSFLRLLFTTPLGELVRGRVTGPAPRIVRTQVAQAHLPALLQMFVEDVVCHTRLWRSEKREIARELACHFADGLEAGRSADQLITDFGDAGQAALLMRRAAKRNRPWPWQAARFTLRATALLLIAMIGVYGILSLRFYLARQGPIVDLRPRMNAAALQVNEDDKAWPLYRQALIATPDRTKVETDLIVKRDFNRFPHPGEEGWESVAAYMEQWKPAFEFARQAADKPGMGLVVGYPWNEADRAVFANETLGPDHPLSVEKAGLVAVLLPHVAHLRNLARNLGWDFERAVAAGEGDIAVADIRAMLGIARHARETPTTINALVSLSVIAMTCERINWALANHPAALSDDHLTELAHALAAMNDRAMSIDYSGERLFFEDVIQRVYSDDGHGDGHVTAAGLEWMQTLVDLSGGGPGEERVDFVLTYVGPAASAIMLGRRDMLDEHARLMAMMEAESSKPLWERDTSQVEALLDQWMRSPLERLRRYPIALLMPALSRASANAELSMMRRDVTLTAIALEVHRRRHGEWPESLADLTPQLLPEIPTDRFDGQPLRYVMRDGKPLLYSVGTDREDDSGTPASYGVGHNGQMWYPRDRTAELVQDQEPVIGANGQRILYYDGDWLMWPPQDEGPVFRRDYSAESQPEAHGQWPWTASATHATGTSPDTPRRTHRTRSTSLLRS